MKSCDAPIPTVVAIPAPEQSDQFKNKQQTGQIPITGTCPANKRAAKAARRYSACQPKELTRAASLDLRCLAWFL